MSNNDAHILALDLGTSGVKAAVVAHDGRIAGAGRAPIDTILLPGAGAEQEPEAVWAACKRACSAALRASGVAPSRVQAVACCSQFASVIPIGHDGQPTMNMIVWLDRRATAARLRMLPGYPRRQDRWWRIAQWVRRNGLAPIGGGEDTLSKARWIRHARPEVYERTQWLLEPADYLTYRLCGRVTATQCSAALFLLTDNRAHGRLEYDPVLLGYSGIDAAKLAPLVPIDCVLGTLLPEVAAELGLLPSAKVVTGLLDTHAAGAGSLAFTGTHAVVGVGSSGVMIAHTHRKRTSLRHGVFSLPSPVEGVYFAQGENGLAGGMLEHFLGHFVYPEDAFGRLEAADRYAAFERAAAGVPPGSGGALFLPWLNGATMPGMDPHMRGGFLNLSMATTRSHLARAVIEGIAMNLRWLHGPLESLVRRRFSHYLYYGGGAESAVWSQTFADVLGAPVHALADPRYVTCRGAALLAFQRLGMLGYDDFAARTPVRAEYAPRREARAVYDAVYPQFVAAFRRNRPVVHAINGAHDRLGTGGD